MDGIAEGKLKLQPLTEIFLLISVSVFSFINYDLKIDIFVLFVIALIASNMGLMKTSIKALLVFALLQTIKFFVLPLLPDIVSAHLGLFVVHGPKLIPIFLVGQILIKTNPVRKIMYALNKMHVPESLTIPLAIGIRYFPSLREEKKIISDAIKLRGIKGFKKFEFGLIPLVITASNTADDLAQAITVRGIENPSRKTFVEDTTLGFFDYVVIVFALGLLARAVSILLG